MGLPFRELGYSCEEGTREGEEGCGASAGDVFVSRDVHTVPSSILTSALMDGCKVLLLDIFTYVVILYMLGLRSSLNLFPQYDGSV